MIEKFTPPKPLNTAVLFLVFNRLDVTKQVFQAIRQAKPPRLYIAADGARKNKEGETEKTIAVRDYVLQNIDWDCEVKTLFREENLGCKYAVSGGIDWFFEQEEMGIILEDVVTAPGFLEFMNQALDFYRNDHSILSIAGYGLPLSIQDYKNDAYALSRFNAWRFGIWQREFQLVEYISKKEYADFLCNKEAVGRFIRGGGEDMLNMLELEVSGKIDAFDVKAMFCQFKKEMLTVYPKKSLVQNIGHDGTGIHCGKTYKFNHNKLWGKLTGFNFLENPQIDERVRKANYAFRKQGCRGKARMFLIKTGLYQMFIRLKYGME